MNYENIIKELNEKRRDLQFSPSLLSSLNENERKDIENRLLNLVKLGVSTSYKYILYLKYIDLYEELPYNKLPNLPLADKLDINKYLYLKTKDKGYLNNIIISSLDNQIAFSLLLSLYNDNTLNDKDNLLNIILSVIKYTKKEIYLRMFQQRIKINNVNLNEIFKNLNPMYWIPSSLNDDYPLSVIDENGKILNKEEATKKLNDDYAKYLEKQNYYEIILSGIMGFAIGDALGVPVEFSKRTTLEVKPVKDMEGYGTYNLPEGTWSDDTSMTIATIDSLIKNGSIDYEDIMKKFLLWKNDAAYTATDRVFDIGIATSSALNKYEYSGKKAVECGGLNERDNGNGSLMRILPIVFYINSLNLSEEEKIDIINNSSSMTHAHEISRLGCKIYSDFIEQLMINGCNKEEAYNYIKGIDYSKYYSQESLEYYKRILKDDISKLNRDDIKSSGFVVSTLEASLWSTLTTNSYEESLIRAVNLGEDTDTIGAITGSMTGIIYKYKSFPKNYKEKLKKSNYLIELSMKFAETLEYNKKKVENKEEVKKTR